MLGSAIKRTGAYAGHRAALRLLPWVWPVYAAIGVYRAFEHELTQRERAKLRRLSRKSLGLPTRLSVRERDEAATILMKLSPFTVARYVAAEASPLPWPKSPASATES